MGLPSAFDVSRTIGNNLANAFSERKESNAIEEILSSAIDSRDPEIIQNSIGKILSQVTPERQGPAIQYLQQSIQQIQAKKERERSRAAEVQAGVTPGLAPALQVQELKNKMPPKAAKPTQASQPIDPEQLRIIESVRQTPEYQNAQPLEKYQQLTRAGVSKENSQAEADIASKQADIGLKAVETSYKNNEDYINKVTDGAQAADEMDMRLDQMKSLKNLPTPLMASTLELLGLPASIFSADAEVAEKLSIDLTKNIQQFYGNRILATEFAAFLRSIPTLKNTPEGQQRIIDNMKKFNQLKRIEYSKLREVEKQAEEKNGPLPRDFRRKIFDEMKPETERLAKEFALANSRPANVPNNFVKVSNGQETLWIDPSAIDDAKADNFEVVK